MLLGAGAEFGGRFCMVVFVLLPCRKQNYQAFPSYFQKSNRALAPVSRARPKLLRTVTTS
jgi:hypothetical protein